MKSFKDFLRESSSYVSEATNENGEIIVSNKTQLRKLIDDFSLTLDKIIIAKNLKDISGAFKNSTRKDFSGLETWDISNVENMADLFENCPNFTGEEIENWDVSRVKDMGNLFKDCKNFNADLSRWDVRNVEYMDFIFGGCKSFTGKGLENWNTTNLKQLHGAFSNCDRFNADFSRWKTSKVRDVAYLFHGCKNFIGKGLEKWDLSDLKHYDKLVFKDSGVKNIPDNFLKKFRDLGLYEY